MTAITGNKKAVATAFILFSCLHNCFIPSYAEDVVVNGKRFEQCGDKLYPRIRSEWTSLDGVSHESWVTDYSTYEAPKTKPMNITINKPINVKSAATPQDSAQQAFSVRDAGSKHYITIGADVLYDFDKYTLNAKAEKVLLSLGPVIHKYGACSVSVEGYTDSIGTDEYNQSLSEKRANSVKDWLLAHKVVSGEVATSGLGEKSPVAPNTYNDGTDYPAGRAKNRRVQIVVDTAAPDSVSMQSNRTE